MARFTDSQLIILLQKAARRINRRLELTDTDCQVSVDASGCVSPSDSDLEDLVLLQAECLIATRDFQSELNSRTDGVLIRDGEQSIDTRQRGIARGTFYNSEHSPCAELEDAIKFEKLRRGGGGCNTGGTGRLIW